MLSSFCEKLLLKMDNFVQEISKKPPYVRAKVGGWVKSKRSHAHRVGGLVKNVLILSVRTLWVTITFSRV